VPDARPPVRINVGGLVLRRWRLADANALTTAVSESLEELRPWLPWASEGRSSQSSFLAATAVAWDDGDRFEYAIEDAAATLLGGAGLMRRIGPRGLEIGYWIHTAHAGRGIAKLATACLTAGAFELPWVDHVEVHHDRANERSGAVPAGLGFTLVKEIAKARLAPGETGRDLVWRIRREQFPASAAAALLEATAAQSAG
jgi:RimJ/RimL family protein N-acetyltransferase